MLSYHFILYDMSTFNKTALVLTDTKKNQAVIASQTPVSSGNALVYDSIGGLSSTAVVNGVTAGTGISITGTSTHPVINSTVSAPPKYAFIAYVDATYGNDLTGSWENPSLPYKTPNAAVTGFSGFYGGYSSLTSTTRAVVSINGNPGPGYSMSTFIGFIDFCSTSGSPVDTSITSIDLVGLTIGNVTFSNLSFVGNVIKSSYTSSSSAVITFNNCIFNGVSMDVGQNTATTTTETYFLFGCQFYACSYSNFASNGALINLRANTTNGGINFYMTDCSLLLPTGSLTGGNITCFVAIDNRANFYSISNIYSYDTMGGNVVPSSTLVLYRFPAGKALGTDLRSTNDVLSLKSSNSPAAGSSFAIMYGSTSAVITFHNLRLTYAASFASPSAPSDGFILPSPGNMTALSLNGSAITSGPSPSSLFIDPSVYGTALVPIVFSWIDTNGINRHSTPISHSSSVVSAGNTINISPPSATAGTPSDFYITTGIAMSINFTGVTSGYLNLKYQFYLITAGSTISTISVPGGSSIVGITSKSSGFLTVYCDGVSTFYTN